MPDAKGATLSLPQLISALSYALDLTEGQQMGHSVRTCIIGMRIALEIGLNEEAKVDLYYALLLKDAGCSSNSSRLFHVLAGDEIRAKRDIKTVDWSKFGWDALQYALRNVSSGAPLMKRLWRLMAVAANNKAQSRELIKIRCERGASVALKIGLSKRTADGIHSLDEHWDGQGHPVGLRGTEIPLLSRIMNLAQTLEVFRHESGENEAMSTIAARRKTWFDPLLVGAANAIHRRSQLFEGLTGPNLKSRVLAMEPAGHEIPATDETLDQVCEAFAEVIDAKSPFTYRHSTGVAQAAGVIGQRMGLDDGTMGMIRRAALLHDIGKLSVPNTILEKPGKLDKAEWDVVKMHPHYTLEILKRVRGFGELADVAATHHEKLDGSGYFRNMTAENMTLPARILVVADIYDALAADRPYREGLDLDTVFGILRKEAPHALDADCVEALATNGAPIAVQLARLSDAVNPGVRQAMPAPA